MFVEELKMKPLPPFSFDLSARIFSNGDRQIRVYEKGKFQQVVRVGAKLVLLSLESQGNTEEPTIVAILKSKTRLDESDLVKIKQITSRLLNMDMELSEFYSLARKDSLLNRVVKSLCGLRSPTTPTIFEALVDSIIEQQISLVVATSIERKMIKRFGEAVEFDGTVFYAYPTPNALSQATIDDLTKCGLSQRKAQYIKDISKLIEERKLNLEEFRNQETLDIVQKLDSLRGVGLWTAELTLIRSLQKWDAMPADDIGLRRIISHYYCNDKKITSEQARKISEPWGKWRGLAAYYFVVADLLNLAP